MCAKKSLFAAGDRCWKHVWRRAEIKNYKVGCRLERYLITSQDCVYNILSCITSDRVLRDAVEAVVRGKLVDTGVIADVARDFGQIQIWKFAVAEGCCNDGEM